MKFISKNSSLHLYLLLILILGILTPYISYANRADYSQDSIEIVCRDACNDNDNTLQLRGVKGGLKSSNVQTRGFEMRRSANNYIAKDGSSVPIGQVLTYENKGPGYDATGAWFFTGGEFDSPDMNGEWYKLGNSSNPVRNSFGDIRVKVNPPANQNPDSFTTTGPVICDNSTRVCTTNGVGDATITLNFPATTAEVRGDSEGGNRPEDRSEFTFRRTSYTYSFSVYNPNSAPTVICTAPFNISYTTAEARWSYSDADGDAQTNANIQVATNPNFNNIVANVNANGNGTTRTITGLSENTTYYTRVSVKNAVNDWTGFSTCTGSFTTLVNNPATVNLNSVAPATRDPDKYTRAVINWTYTDPENDPQTKVEIAISTNSNFPNNANTTTYVSNGADLSYTTALASLLPGETYYVKVRAQNEPNGWSEWSNSRSVTMPNYPDPEFDFKLTGDGKTVNYDDSDKTLVLKTGDRVNAASWSINNGTEVGLESCTLSTTGGGNLASSIPGQPGEPDFKNSLSFTGPGDGLPSRNINGVQVPTITEDRTYDVTLNCTGKLAKTVRSVNQVINLKVESYPIITSCSVDGNNTVQAGQTDVNIKATVGNVSSYRFKIGRKNGDNDPLTEDTSTPNLNRTLSYAGIEFGRHTPWLEVTRLPNRTVRDTCGTVTNLGDSNIKEVR